MGNIPKGYKQTEVGVIPEDWEVKKLGDCCRKITDGTHDTPKPIDNGIPFLTAIHVKDNFIDFDNCYFLPQNIHETIYKRCNPEKGDVLMVNIGAGVATTALVYVDYEFSLKNVALLKPDNASLIGSYLNYYQALSKTRITNSISTGGAQPFLSLKQISGLLIALPTKAEQTAIAATLSDADALISSLEKLIAKKRNIKQGAMQQLLKPKDNWAMKKLGDILTFSGGYSASREQLSNEGFCYLHYGDIHGAKKTFINVKNEYTEIPKLNILLKNVSPKSLLNDGDIVFVDASEDDEGTSRHLIVKNPDGIPYISGLHTIVAKSTDDLLDNDFKRYCFQTKVVKSQFKFYAVGTKVSGISKTNIAKIEIAIPPKSEQTRIAAILSDTDAEIEALERKLAKYRMIKQGMMQELLTGKTRLV